MKNKWKSLGWVGLYMAIFLICTLALSFLLVIAIFVVAIQNGFVRNSALVENIMLEVLRSLKGGTPFLVLNGALDLILLTGYGLWYYFREKKYHFYPDYQSVFSMKNVLSIAGIAFFSQYCLDMLCVFIHMFAPRLWDNYVKTIGSFEIRNPSPWVIFFSVCLLGPVMEEVVFRGMIYGRLRRGFSMMPAMLISALLFGIIHMNWVQGIYATMVGFILAYIYEKTQTIWACCLLHAVFNSSNYIKAAIEKWLENIGVLIPDAVCFLYGPVAAVFVFLLVRRFRGRPIYGRNTVSDN